MDTFCSAKNALIRLDGEMEAIEGQWINQSGSVAQLKGFDCGQK